MNQPRPNPAEGKMSPPSDSLLIAQLNDLARASKAVEAEIVGHLAVFIGRKLYRGFSLRSPYAYVTGVLGFSRDVALQRIRAAKAVNIRPDALGYLASGALTLSSLAALAPAIEVPGALAFALGRSKRDVQRYVARCGHRRSPRDYETRSVADKHDADAINQCRPAPGEAVRDDTAKQPVDPQDATNLAESGPEPSSQSYRDYQKRKPTKRFVARGFGESSLASKARAVASALAGEAAALDPRFALVLEQVFDVVLMQLDATPEEDANAIGANPAHAAHWPDGVTGANGSERGKSYPADRIALPDEVPMSSRFNPGRSAPPQPKRPEDAERLAAETIRSALEVLLSSALEFNAAPQANESLAEQTK